MNDIIEYKWDTPQERKERIQRRIDHAKLKIEDYDKWSELDTELDDLDF